MAHRSLRGNRAAPRGVEGVGLDDVWRVADRAADGLPPTDQVHAFLDLLDAAHRLDG